MGSRKIKIAPGVDPRAASQEKIVPPAPLPYVSRRALARVKNPIPAPTCCPYCSGPVELVNNSAIYRREYGDWPYAYLCRPCDAYVGLHPDTDIPLGTLANADLRKARKDSKTLFHAWMDANGLSRKAAYQWLAEHLGISVGECHFGWFDVERCSAAARLFTIEAEKAMEAHHV